MSLLLFLSYRMDGAVYRQEIGCLCAVKAGVQEAQANAPSIYSKENSVKENNAFFLLRRNGKEVIFPVNLLCLHVGKR